MSFDNLCKVLKGGSGSGNFGHEGRPGKIGGSSGGKGLSAGNVKSLQAWATNDYQGRSRTGGYPRSDVPDTIDVYTDPGKLTVVAQFKNTRESTAETWMRKNLMAKVGDASKDGKYKAYQSGDYQDDWVTVNVDFDVD